MDWRIYYGDDSSFSSEDGEPHDAPRTNVQIITQFMPDENGYELISDYDYYYHDGTTYGWYRAYNLEVPLLLIRLRYPLILFGQMMSSERFNALSKRVIAELPGKKIRWRHRQRGTE